jgi:trimeric autotransporter adhesin
LLSALFLPVLSQVSLTAATLSIPNETANPGGTAIAGISLGLNGETISAIQFDLTWDASLALNIAPASVVGSSSKILFTASPQPGTLRCLLAGFDTNALSAGSLLLAFVTVSSSATAGSAEIALNNVIAAAPDGSAVAIQSSSGTVQIQSGPATQLIEPQGILNAASLQPATLSPGEIITLFAPITTPSPLLLVNGTAAPVLYAGSDQLNAIVPFELNASSPATLVLRQGQSSGTTMVPAAAVNPAIFTIGSDGTGPGAILNQDYSTNSPGNPAAPGSTLMVYGTGFGALTPAPTDGQIATVAAHTNAAVTATLGGVSATVSYAGAAPDLVSGVTQINVVVPQGLPANPFTPIVLTIGSASTQPGVTVAIQ